MSEGTFESVTAAPPPPPPRQPRRTNRTVSRGATSKPPRTSRGTPSRAVGPPQPLDLTEKINGAIQSWIAAPLLTAGIITRKRELLADAAVVAEDGPKLAAEVNELAKENPQVAQLIEKITKAVPYSAILQILVTMGAKIATNHRPQLLPFTSKIFGAKPLDEAVGTQEELDEQLRLLATVAATSPNGRPPDAGDNA
jgi:hypothetical protein